MSQQRQSSSQLLALSGFTNSVDAKVFDDEEDTRRPWWKRFWLIGLIVVLLAGGATGFFIWRAGSNAPVTYRYQQVTQGNLTLTVNATGPIQSPATYNLVAATTAPIHDILVRVGQKVTQGQVLAHLDATALQDAVNQAQAQVNADQDTLYNTQVNAGWVTTPAVTQAQDTLNIALAQLAAAQHNLANATLKAPHAGVVTMINGTVGGAPGVPVSGSAGSGSGTGAANGTFIQVVDLSSLQIQANVNEADTANMRVGDSVQFTVAAYGSRIFNGTVSAISPSGVNNSNVISYPVIIDISMQTGFHATPFSGASRWRILVPCRRKISEWAFWEN